MEDHQAPLEAKIEITFNNPQHLSAIYKSLLPETLSPVDMKRGRVEISAYTTPQPTLTLTIKAKNTSSFKALLNAYIYLLKTAIDVL